MLKNPESTLSNEYNNCKPYARRKKNNGGNTNLKKRQPRNQNPWGKKKIFQKENKKDNKNFRFA